MAKIGRIGEKDKDTNEVLTTDIVVFTVVDNGTHE